MTERRQGDDDAQGDDDGVHRVVAVSTVDLLDLESSSIDQFQESVGVSSISSAQTLDIERYLLVLIRLILSQLSRKSTRDVTLPECGIDSDDNAVTDDAMNETLSSTPDIDRTFALIVKADMIEARLRANAFQAVLCNDNPVLVSNLMQPITSGTSYRLILFRQK
jgi:hypothetical protein